MHKQTIALIDDDRNILTSLSIALEKEGFKVQTYIDGESALIGLTRTPPDLAVVDIKVAHRARRHAGARRGANPRRCHGLGGRPGAARIRRQGPHRP